jgi:hypothetical protein
MTTRPAKDFNSKAKTYLYSVGAAPKKKSGKKAVTDFTEAAEKMMAQVKTLAEREGFTKDVDVKLDNGALSRLGIFFMNAPEKFAALVRKEDGIHYVEKSGSGTRKTIPSGLRRGKK